MKILVLGHPRMAVMLATALACRDRDVLRVESPDLLRLQGYPDFHHINAERLPKHVRAAGPMPRGKRGKPRHW